jgi:hypothetical protein
MGRIDSTGKLHFPRMLLGNYPLTVDGFYTSIYQRPRFSANLLISKICLSWHDYCGASILLNIENEADMRFGTLALLALAFSVHASGVANVIYEWHSVDNATPKDVSMKIVFTDEVVESGGFNARVFVSDYHYLADMPGLVSIDFHAAGTGWMHFAPAEQRHFSYIDLNMSMSFLRNGTLSGGFYFNDSDTDVRVSGADGLFSIVDLHSDRTMDGEGIRCSGEPDCRWSTGYMQRTKIPPSHVPEPASWPLLGAGVLGLIAAGRRRKTPGA